MQEGTTPLAKKKIAQVVDIAKGDYEF